MIKYEKLREFLSNSEKYPGCKKYNRAPLIHKGFPGTFNLSFTEYDMFTEFGGYSNFDRDLIFSTIQSCIRTQDILENINNGKDLWKYLGVFEMSDIAGQITLSKKEDIKIIHVWQLNKLINVLEKLGLDKKKIYPSYCKGGSVAKLTNNKYSFSYEIPEDTLTKNAFIEAGIPEKNLIPDESRDTLLSLHINMPTPWGYRNEINYNVGTEAEPRLLDIGTLEYFLWLPIYSSEEKVSKNIIGLEDFKHTISIGAFGIERLCFAINNLDSIQEVDYIKKYYDLFKQLYPDLSDEQRTKSGECLRTLHRIYSDVVRYNLLLGRQQKEKIRKFLRILIDNIGDYDEKKFRELLELNSKVQPWHKDLSKGIEPTIKRINDYCSLH